MSQISFALQGCEASQIAVALRGVLHAAALPPPSFLVVFCGAETFPLEAAASQPLGISDALLQ